MRIIGEVTAEKVKMVQEADAIFREEIARAGLDRRIGQYFCGADGYEVGRGDGRFQDVRLRRTLRAVTTSDFMTAEPARLPWELLEKVTTRIVNEVEHVNRVLYDCTGKPPATIEWEYRHLPEKPFIFKGFRVFCSGYMKGTRRVHEKFMRKPPSGLQLPPCFVGYRWE